MAEVFVSYKAEDRARVAPLVRALEGQGVSVWWDAHIGAGDDWRDTILRNLEMARAVIVIWSKRSVGAEGQFVRDEASRAVKRKAYLPVRIDKVELPLGFGETQANDLIGWKGDTADPRYLKILAALEESFLVRPPSRNGNAVQGAPVNRRGLIVGGAAAAAVASGAAAIWYQPWAPRRKDESIAVLPFENLSGDPAQAYFSDGIAEELRSVLAGIPGLKVMARTSSEAVRNDDAVTAARKLHVQDILTGSVRRSPEMMRISAQLVDGADGTQRWSAVYDRPPGDALKIQSEIADKVAAELRLTLGHLNNDVRLRGGTSNVQAQDLYLRSIASHDGSEAGLRAALAYAESALIEDPQYGDAMRAKARRLLQLSSTYAANGEDARALAKQSENAARRAIELSPQSSAAHVSLGTIYFWQFRFNDALTEFSKAQSLGDQPGADLGIVAWMLAMLKRFGPALRMSERAVVLDPLNPGVLLERANVLVYSGRTAQAEETIQRAIRIDPKQWYPHLVFALMLVRTGRYAEAQNQMSAIDHDSQSIVAVKAVIAERLGDRSRANALLQEILRSPAYSAGHYQVAQIYVQQNRPAEALAELRAAFAERDSGLAQIQTDFLFDPIRQNADFTALVRDLNFPA